MKVAVQQDCHLDHAAARVSAEIHAHLPEFKATTFRESARGIEGQSVLRMLKILRIKWLKAYLNKQRDRYSTPPAVSRCYYRESVLNAAGLNDFFEGRHHAMYAGDVVSNQRTFLRNALQGNSFYHPFLFRYLGPSIALDDHTRRAEMSSSRVNGAIKMVLNFDNSVCQTYYCKLNCF